MIVINIYIVKPKNRDNPRVFFIYLPNLFLILAAASAVSQTFAAMAAN